MESRSDLGPDEPGSFAAIPRSILDAKSSICRCAHTPADQTMLDFSAQAVLRKNNLSKRRQVTDDLHFLRKSRSLRVCVTKSTKFSTGFICLGHCIALRV